jgi:hypothetical protein
LTRFPLQYGKSDDQKHQGIDRNKKRCAQQRQQNAGESGAHNSGEVQLHSPQSDRGSQLIFAGDLRDDGTPNRGIKRDPQPEHEDSDKDQVWVNHPGPCTKSE